MSARFVALLFAFGQAGIPAPRVVPRVILAIYDSHYEKDVRDTRIHRLLEMPLNHLGLIVRYQDRNSGLPPPEKLQDVRGILTWFQSDAMENPEEFLAWAEAAIDAGKHFAVLGELSVGRNLRGQATRAETVNHFLGKLGLRVADWTPVTYNVRIVYKDAAMMDFERPLPAVLPPFDRIQSIDPRMLVHLVARRANDRATDGALVVTGPHGGYAANGYTHFESAQQDQLQWYLNPFEFFRRAFATDEVPKADTTTLVGRRIYYSHIDGDGWRNVTEVARYRAERLSAAEVILREAIQPFPDLPVTVGPIAADLDPRWFGNGQSLSVAKEIFALPWVEAGSHTYSHPLDWESLAQSRLSAAQGGVWAWWSQALWPFWERVAEQWSRPEVEESKPSEDSQAKKPKLWRGHSRLRSYDLYPFDPDLEIRGSIEFLNGLLPRGKRVKLLQWSGTTLESESILEATRQAGVRNINGGDTRFDPEFESYAWVAPLGRQVGRYRQVYSSDSNENTYTNLWNERYFGFRYLVQTLRRTESPIRVKPFNLYYHMFSGEKQPGLDAVLGNLAFARSQDVAPITASQFAAIVDGFFSVVVTDLGARRWRIENRGELNTIRFDNADRNWVDWDHARGVMGARHFQGSLYVALDPAEEAPIVALEARTVGTTTRRPYLVESRWMVSHLEIGRAAFSFEASGFGSGEMEWQVRPGARYVIRRCQEHMALPELAITASMDGKLRFRANDGPAGGRLTVTAIEAGGAR